MAGMKCANLGSVTQRVPLLPPSGNNSIKRKTAENFPPFKMSLSSQLRADLDSVAAALATCDSILDRKTEEQEAAEWLESFSRWAD